MDWTRFKHVSTRQENYVKKEYICENIWLVWKHLPGQKTPQPFKERILLSGCSTPKLGNKRVVKKSKVGVSLELVSKDLNHLAAILHVYAGGLNFMN